MLFLSLFLDNDQIIMMIAIALCVATVALGICIGIYVQCRRKYNIQRNKIREMRKVINKRKIQT